MSRRTGLSALVSLEVSRAVDAAVEALPEGSCRWDATNLLEALRNGSEDALRVLDATGKPGSSILRGNLRLLGDFDECVAVPVSRYCLADVRLPAPADIDNATARLLSIATAGRWLFEDIPRRSVSASNSCFSLFLTACAPKASTRDIPKMPLLNSMINVDSFFLISGMLRAMNFMRDVQQRGGFWIATGILQRLLRLTPAYAVVLAVYACLLPYFGSGPEWNTQVGYNSKMCKQHWMFNIMYVNNYINYENMCMLQSWYLSADMQLFVCALIILIPLYYWHKIGELLLGLVIFVSVALPFATVLIRRLPGLYQPTQPDDQLYEYMRDVYMATHNRMTPYLVGLALGYLLHRIKGQPVTKSKVLIGVGWTVSLLVLGAVVWGPYHLLQECASLTTTTLESAAYAALHRFTWALALGWIIIACYHNLRFGVIGDAVKGILESSTWQPLSRLSYCIFLTHIAVLIINSGRIRTPIFMDEYLLMHSYAGDLAIVLLISMALHLFVEAPSLFLARTIFSRQGNQQQPSKIVKSQTPHQKNTVDQKKKQQRWQHVSPTDIPTSSECPVGQP
ncbi:O-acyltransferase like protein-like [Schistocerca serialis cubense]|uniref:O-acyltransferase like protein-like n=1 Tax=Schistocerca serialis cubense TaxID=2023355 RepID=UPI00214E39B0|nr:O-acyltransferase like protein-like [Schistocerca serialis cubense]